MSKRFVVFTVYSMTTNLNRRLKLYDRRKRGRLIDTPSAQYATLPKRVVKIKFGFTVDKL